MQSSGDDDVPKRVGPSRRDLLRSGALAFVSVTIPGWNVVFGQGRTDADAVPEPGVILHRAVADRRRRGRPLLILHAPKGPDLHSPGSRSWATYFREVHAEGLVDLALCDVVCAFDGEIELEFPDLAGTEWMSGIALFLEPGAAVPTVVHGPELRVRDKGTWAECRADAHNLVDVVHTKLHALIAADTEMIAKRVEQNRAALGDAERQSLGDLDRPIRVLKEHVRPVPAWVLMRASAEPLRGKQSLEWLREEALYRYRVASPEGSLWGRPSACGIVLERFGYHMGYGPCGMAFGSPEGTRFLYFYTVDEIEKIRQRSAERRRK